MGIQIDSQVKSEGNGRYGEEEGVMGILNRMKRRCSTRRRGEQWKSKKREYFRFDIREVSFLSPPCMESNARAGAGTVRTEVQCSVALKLMLPGNRLWSPGQLWSHVQASGK